MHCIYNLLLFIIYFGILIHCQRARGGGGGARGEYIYFFISTILKPCSYGKY